MPGTEITALHQIGEKRAKLFQKLGIFTFVDLLRYYPRSYEDRTIIKPIAQVMDGETVCICATALSILRHNFVRKGMTYQKVVVGDSTGTARITWFNQPWLQKNFDLSTEYIFFGKAVIKNGQVEFISPLFEARDNQQLTGRIMPIYPLTTQLTQKMMQSAIAEVLPLARTLHDPLPPAMREQYELCGIDYAIENIHFPETQEKLAFARRRLAFEELFILQLGLRLLKQRRTELDGIPLADANKAFDFIKTLPFHLTGAQQRVAQEILHDMQQTKPMNRLVQGDVGCGKTVVAAIAMCHGVANGTQAAMMAPTEILAKQHYETLTTLFRNTSIRVVLLTGSQTAAQKKQIYQLIASGEANVVVGTHALIQQKVVFDKLALVVTDEQHRFGVKQRAALAEKGDAPHMLVMTATPIPRTLALIVYGDLDVSVIDELPPGRKLVETFPVEENMRARINQFMRSQLQEGRQVYIVCPLVEENETNDLKAVTHFAQHLQEKVFTGHCVGFLHGKLKPKEKNEIMERFEAGEIHVLVSTTVIEVGVNIPNANTMIVENAERFGLSQLHQLRGRVGRGQWQSYCILFRQGGGEVTTQRLNIMKQTNDGFLIAEKDLELRGPGEFFGTRQHGVPELKVANLYTDMALIAQAGQAADQIIASDRGLATVENHDLRQEVIEMFGQNDIFEFN